ncbi:MAG: hypothetical protein ABIJ28_00710, partial [Patescibacteria group bacterium]
MTKLIKTISSNQLQNEKKIFKILVVSLCLIGILYFYFASSTIFYIINKNNGLGKINSINLDCQGLEENYFAMANDLNLDTMFEKGFVEETKGNFAVRQTTMAQR